MSQSLSKLYVHNVFHTKYSSVNLRQEDFKALFAYMGAIIKDNESSPIIINGVENHVHVFCIMSKTIALAKLVEEIKRHSSRWIKTRGDYYKNFAWQGGYGGFSVSHTMFNVTIEYIRNQQEHHRKKHFKDEYKGILKSYCVEYDERYLWRD